MVDHSKPTFYFISNFDSNQLLKLTLNLEAIRQLRIRYNSGKTNFEMESNHLFMTPTIHGSDLIRYSAQD